MIIIKYNYARSVYYNEEIEYLFDSEIIEYDMRDGGFSLIKQFKLLPEDKIAELEKLHKGIQRHIVIGKIQRDNKPFSEALLTAFAEMRKMFIELNSIEDEKLLAIKKDALFTIGPCKKLQFGQVEFVPKNIYSSYIRFPNISNLELYYSAETGITVKGMVDRAVNKHRLYMLDMLTKYIEMMESRDSGIKRWLIKFINQYKALELDEAYYLEFNHRSVSPEPFYNFQNVLIPLTTIVLREGV